LIKGYESDLRLHWAHLRPLVFSTLQWALVSLRCVPIFGHFGWGEGATEPGLVVPLIGRLSASREQFDQLGDLLALVLGVSTSNCVLNAMADVIAQHFFLDSF
jgi:hypothetical protein